MKRASQKANDYVGLEVELLFHLAMSDRNGEFQ